MVYAAINSTQPIWESPVCVTVPWLWALLHPEEPPLCPLHQPVCPGDQFTGWVFPPIFYPHTSRNDAFSPRPIYKKVNQMRLTVEWSAFHWPFCERSHRAVNTCSSTIGMHGENIRTFNCCTDVRNWSTFNYDYKQTLHLHELIERNV